MTAARTGTVLYTPAILSLAVELARYPLDDGLLLRGEAVSRLCGSRVTVGLALDPGGAVARVGALVTACAIGQAAAALYLNAAAGRTARGHAATLQALETWLSGEGALPDWPGLDALAPARDHPARHGAILLPWKAALGALSKPAAAG
jgi:NifU-like protein involved in Fe-S cluster formation